MLKFTWWFWLQCILTGTPTAHSFARTGPVHHITFNANCLTADISNRPLLVLLILTVRTLTEFSPATEILVVSAHSGESLYLHKNPLLTKEKKLSSNPEILWIFWAFSELQLCVQVGTSYIALSLACLTMHLTQNSLCTIFLTYVHKTKASFTMMWKHTGIQNLLDYVKDCQRMEGFFFIVGTTIVLSRVIC